MCREWFSSTLAVKEEQFPSSTQRAFHHRTEMIWHMIYIQLMSLNRTSKVLPFNHIRRKIEVLAILDQFNYTDLVFFITLVVVIWSAPMLPLLFQVMSVSLHRYTVFLFLYFTISIPNPFTRHVIVHPNSNLFVKQPVLTSVVAILGYPFKGILLFISQTLTLRSILVKYFWHLYNDDNLSLWQDTKTILVEASLTVAYYFYIVTISWDCLVELLQYFV